MFISFFPFILYNLKARPRQVLDVVIGVLCTLYPVIFLMAWACIGAQKYSHLCPHLISDAFKENTLIVICLLHASLNTHFIHIKERERESERGGEKVREGERKKVMYI